MSQGNVRRSLPRAARPPLRSAAGSGALVARACRAERERIGQELHDGVCQTLLAISCELKAQAVQAKLKGEAGAAALDDAARRVGAAIQEAHAAAFRLLENPTEPVEAVGALRDMLGRFEKVVPCEFRTALAEWRLPAQQARHLCRLAQEAVVNAARHAQAARVRCTLVVEEGLTILRVEDDGCGFLPDEPGQSGLGLRIMHQRAAALGARLRIISAPGEGTLVSCALRHTQEI